MTVTIEREDKKSEPRAKEIQQNWRAWARTNGFIQEKTESIEVGSLRVVLEIWEQQQSKCLIYMPPILSTQGGDILYITERDI